MKTEKDLKAEIADQKKRVEAARASLMKAEPDKERRPVVWKGLLNERKKAEDRLRFLQGVLPYVRSSPRPEFLADQIKKVGGEIKFFEEAYKSKYPDLRDPKHRQRYEKENNLPMLRKQFNTLKYLNS